jgi:hypothetical protein
MALTHQADGMWRFEVVGDVKAIERYLHVLANCGEEYDHLHLKDFMDWETIQQYSTALRAKFYSRAVLDGLFPTVEQLANVLRKELKTALNSLLGYIAFQWTAFPENLNGKWLELLKQACAAVNTDGIKAKKHLMRIWNFATGQEESSIKRLLATVFPCEFYMLIMTETSKNEHVNEWKAIFNRRLRE